MTDGLFTPLTSGRLPPDALAFAIYRSEMADTIAPLPPEDQVKLVKTWFVKEGAIWNPPGGAWGPLEGELTLFGMTAYGDTFEAAITSWIKHVRRSEQQAMEDAA